MEFGKFIIPIITDNYTLWASLSPAQVKAGKWVPDKMPELGASQPVDFSTDERMEENSPKLVAQISLRFHRGDRYVSTVLM